MNEKKVNIVEDVSFGSSNKVFSALLVELKRNGMAKVDHHPEITPDDLQKLYLSFDLNTPKGLQQNNRRYVYQAVDELDKNHRENDDPQDSTTDRRMYEQPGALCPAKSFELYLSKLHPELKCLWQRPKEATADICWYCNVPVGKNTLGNFMKNISRAADLSKEYTNHSIRATAITAVLDYSNFEARHILVINQKRASEVTHVAFQKTSKEKFPKHLVRRVDFLLKLKRQPCLHLQKPG
ncbi:Hypothetical predicted protein [Paramuricea clavata]|uniref:Uncharacterized protein n=1 Tax=Paramuricea clavata TaxID=317549 RepID=A0A6S7ITF6_PARCT|nr:Hypothetical predicted protein [Paramuricea clavata]